MTKPLNIMGVEVGIVVHYKYLGIHLNNRQKNIRGLADYFLRTLRSFNVCSKMVELFNQFVVASAIYCAVVCRESDAFKTITASEVNI